MHLPNWLNKRCTTSHLLQKVFNSTKSHPLTFVVLHLSNFSLNVLLIPSVFSILFRYFVSSLSLTLSLLIGFQSYCFSTSQRSSCFRRIIRDSSIEIYVCIEMAIYIFTDFIKMFRQDRKGSSESDAIQGDVWLYFKFHWMANHKRCWNTFESEHMTIFHFFVSVLLSNTRLAYSVWLVAISKFPCFIKKLTKISDIFFVFLSVADSVALSRSYCCNHKPDGRERPLLHCGSICTIVCSSHDKCLATAKEEVM